MCAWAGQSIASVKHHVLLPQRQWPHRWARPPRGLLCRCNTNTRRQRRDHQVANRLPAGYKPAVNRHRPPWAESKRLLEAAHRRGPPPNAMDRHAVVVGLWWAQRVPEREDSEQWNGPGRGKKGARSYLYETTSSFLVLGRSIAQNLPVPAQD